MRRFVSFLSLLAILFASGSFVLADETAMPLADGKFTLTRPESWKKKQPKINIIEHECEIPAAEGDPAPGRMTIMAAGGSIDDNITRWVGQFEDRGDVKKQELAVAGQKIHFVDINGTFKDQPGPFAPAVKRENYRMLGAIIATEKSGNIFVKFYGPKATVAANEDAFKKMLDGLKAN